MSLHAIWHATQTTIAGIGAWLAAYLGGLDGLVYALIIFTLVGLAHLIDVHVLDTPGVLRAAVIFFYLSNEGISLIENATRLGLPVPAQMRGALDAIANRAETRPPLTKPSTANNPTEKENQS
ncbi:phage holin family protein [Arcanobacterium hippocoleae]